MKQPAAEVLQRKTELAICSVCGNPYGELLETPENRINPKKNMRFFSVMEINISRIQKKTLYLKPMEILQNLQELK